ncbi:hypothetical protein [Bradyrhizobium barranii]
MTTIAVKPNTAVVRKLREDPAYRAKEAERRLRYREKEYAATKRRRSTPEGWARHQIAQIKHRAKKSGLTFDLTWESIVPPDNCPVFGTPLRLSGGTTAKGYQPLPDAASVDRVDNRLGYVRGNVRVISFRANILKKDAAPEELRRLADWLDKEAVS